MRDLIAWRQNKNPCWRMTHPSYHFIFSLGTSRKECHKKVSFLGVFSCANMPLKVVYTFLLGWSKWCPRPNSTHSWIPYEGVNALQRRSPREWCLGAAGGKHKWNFLQLKKYRCISKKAGTINAYVCAYTSHDAIFQCRRSDCLSYFLNFSCFCWFSAK